MERRNESVYLMEIYVSNRDEYFSILLFKSIRLTNYSSTVNGNPNLILPLDNTKNTKKSNIFLTV